MNPVDLIQRLRDQRMLEARRTATADTLAERTSAGYREQLIFDAIDTLAAKDTALAEMRVELETATATTAFYVERSNDLDALLDTANADLARARKALEPFALVAEKDIDHTEPDSDRYTVMRPPYNLAPLLTYGDFRNAARALGPSLLDEGVKRG